MSFEYLWTSCDDRMPPEGVTVMAKIVGGDGDRNEGKLVMKGPMWFLPDMSMYVYYAPTHWRYA